MLCLCRLIAQTCRKWEEVDHELEDSVAGALLSPTSGNESEGDPLNLGSNVRYLLSISLSTTCLHRVRSVRDLDMDTSADCFPYFEGVSLLMTH